MSENPGYPSPAKEHGGLTFLDDVHVEVIQHVGGDASIVQSARVSLAADLAGTAFSGSADTTRDKGLINYLMSHRHGTPFEHNSITFGVEAPIFVFREWHRHRIQSYNEMSGRYTELPPRFYTPSPNRPLVNIGTSARPEMAPAEPEVIEAVHEELIGAYTDAWNSYQKLLGTGIAKEVARLVLPVGIMSRMYATANLRAWLAFLSLRSTADNATYQGHPQREIEMAAEKVEQHLFTLFPEAILAFNANGRVAP